MERALIPREPHNIQKMQRKGQPLDIPLGTAAWHQFGANGQPIYEEGDILVGHTDDGEAVGVKDQGHIGIIAKTRSGKGTGLIVPNLILWPGSVVVIDPKGENAILTARRRGNGSAYAKGMGQRVHLLDPFGEVETSFDSFDDLKASFNPMDILSEAKHEAVDDAARIADSLIDSDSSTADPFWNEAAQGLIKAVMLHIVSSDDFEAANRNLLTLRDLILEGYAELRALLADNLEGGNTPTAYALLFRAMRKNPAFYGEVSKAGERFARMEENSPRMLESIAQVACTNLDFLASTAMQRLVRTSSFSLSDLKNDARGTSLYLCLPQRFMGTHFRFLRMMVTLILAEMERIKHRPRCGYPVLMVLDEFAALKRMQVIENAAAQIAGFGVRMMFVVQTLGQLKETYKENWQTLLGNCTTKIFFCNDDPFTQETVSKLIGDVEVVRQTHSQSAARGSSSSTAHGSSVGISSGSSFGTNTSYSVNQQGLSTSSSFSSSQNRGMTASQSRTDTFGQNQSHTSGLNESIHKRALITPDEVGRFFGDLDNPKSLVLLSGQNPLSLKRIPYYRSNEWHGYFDPSPGHALPPTRSQLKSIVMQEAERKRQAERVRAAKQEALDMQRYRKDEKEFADYLEREKRKAQIAFNSKLEAQRQKKRKLYFKLAWISGACALGALLLFLEAYKTFFLIYIICCYQFYHWLD